MLLNIQLNACTLTLQGACTTKALMLRTANQATVRNGPSGGPKLPLRMGVYGRLAMAR